MKLFNTQKPTEPMVDAEERERKAEAIKREIEDARKAQIEEKVKITAAKLQVDFKKNKTHI